MQSIEAIVADFKIDEDRVFIMPMGISDTLLAQAAKQLADEIIKRRKRWRLTPRLQFWLGIPSREQKTKEEER